MLKLKCDLLGRNGHSCDRVHQSGAPRESVAHAIPLRHHWGYTFPAHHLGHCLPNAQQRQRVGGSQQKNATFIQEFKVILT